MAGSGLVVEVRSVLAPRRSTVENIERELGAARLHGGAAGRETIGRNRFLPDLRRLADKPIAGVEGSVLDDRVVSPVEFTIGQDSKRRSLFHAMRSPPVDRNLSEPPIGRNP